MASRQGRALSKEERLTVLAAYRMNPSIRGVARALGFSPGTVQTIIQGLAPAAPRPKTPKPIKLPPAGKRPGKKPQNSPLPSPVRTLKEIQTRDRAWDLVGANVLAIQSLQLMFQQEIDAELPDMRRINELALGTQRLMIAYGISVEKARLLHNEATAITARVEEMNELPPGVTQEDAVLIMRRRVHGIHPGLLPENQALPGLNVLPDITP